MQVSEQLSLVPTPCLPAEPIAKGPSVIDPLQFKLVAGGSPRGGWDEPTAVAATADDPFSPRGGW